MRNEFIETSNVSKFNAMCEELVDPESIIGPSLGTATGHAGRGKSESAKHFAIQTNAVYLPPFNVRSPGMLLREITFELCQIKPGRIEACKNMIADEMAKERRLIIIDEADLLDFQVLEMIRNLNENLNCPIVLIGEEGLRGKLASRERLRSRVRRQVEFGPITQPDVMLYFKRALDQRISPEVAAAVHRHSKGDWRPVLTLAIGLERAMRASGINEITVELAKDVIRNS